MTLTKEELAFLAAFLERGAHQKLAGIRSDAELECYHQLRIKLRAMAQELDTPKEPANEPK